LGDFLRIVDNTTTLLGDDLKRELSGATKFWVAAACFSIYAFDALKAELGKLKELEFIFTSPTFIPNGAVARLKKEGHKFLSRLRERKGRLWPSSFNSPNSLFPKNYAPMA